MRTIRAVDLFCGKGGWAHGLIAAGWAVDGYDIADMGGYPGSLHLRNVLTLTGEDVADAELIVASPPCQAYSYMAMPWTRAKVMGERHRSCWGLRHKLTELFRFCFRLQKMAICVRGGRHLPLIVENVCGAQAWVGRATWHYGSFYLWGDVPALMPRADAKKNTGGSWFGMRDGAMLDRNDPRDVRRNPDGAWDNAAARGGWNHPGKALDGRKDDGVKQGGEWWHDPASMTRRFSSRSTARKEASARIAMIPFPLARWIGECYLPPNAVSVRTARALCAEVLRA